MSDFVLLYSGGNMPETDEEKARVMKAWDGWYTELGGAIKDGGNPFAPASQDHRRRWQRERRLGAAVHRLHDRPGRLAPGGDGPGEGLARPAGRRQRDRVRGLRGDVAPVRGGRGFAPATTSAVLSSPRAVVPRVVLELGESERSSAHGPIPKSISPPRRNPTRPRRQSPTLPQASFWMTQNRLPSGSARTTKSSSGSGVRGWIVAPSPTIRSISASRSSA